MVTIANGNYPHIVHQAILFQFVNLQGSKWGTIKLFREVVKLDTQTVAQTVVGKIY